MQRTRSSPSAPHSPLTRRPLGDVCRRLAAGTAVLFLLIGQLSARSRQLAVPNYALEEQLNKAAVVAFVSVRAGDADMSRPPIYRGQVVDSIKGAKPKETLCFMTPAGRLEIGSEYLVILEPAEVSRTEPLVAFCAGSSSIYQTLRQGQEPLPVRYTLDVPSLCPAERCPPGAEAVEVWGFALPQFVQSFPVRDVPREREGHVWVRKAQMILALRYQLGGLTSS